MMTENARVYSYQRVSTLTQKEGAGLPRQNQAAEKWCQEHGRTLDKSLVLRHVGRSGGGIHKLKGVLGGFLKAVERGAVPEGSFLLIDDFSRLSREEVTKALSDFLNIINAGICIVCLSDNGRVYSQDNMDLPSLVMSIMSMSRANEENEFKRRNATRNWELKIEALKRGELVAVKLPRWLEADQVKVAGRMQVKGYRINQRAAKIVRRIFAERSKGMPYNVIAKKLNIDGVPVFSSHGRKWTQVFIKDILSHKTVIGTVTLKDYEQADYFPAIISKADFDKVQAMGSKPTRSGGRNAERVVCSTVLTGLLKCPECGDSMTLGYSKGEARYIRCSGNRYGGCTHKGSWRHEHIEDLILTYLADVLEVSDLVSNNGDDSRLTQAQREHTEALERKVYLETAVDNLSVAIAEAASKMVIQTLSGKLDTAGAELDQLDERIKILANTVAELSVDGRAVSQRIENMRQLIQVMKRSKDDGRVQDARLMLKRQLSQTVDRIVVFAQGVDVGIADEVLFEGVKRPAGHQNWNAYKRFLEVHLTSGEVRIIKEDLTGTNPEVVCFTSMEDFMVDAQQTRKFMSRHNGGHQESRQSSDR